MMTVPSDNSHSPGNRATLIASIQAQAEDVCGEPGKPAQWLTRSNRLLGNRTLLEAVKTDRGFQAVPTNLGRIEYGVFS